MAAMIGRKQRPRSVRALVVIAVSAALILNCKYLGTDILSGLHSARRSTVPPLKISESQVGRWRKALFERLADAIFLVPVRVIPDLKPLESETRTLRLYHVHTR